MTESVSCPFCDGEISETATKCRHCGEWVSGQCQRCGADVRGRWAAQRLCAQCEGSTVPVPAPIAQHVVEPVRGSGGNVLAALVSFFLPGLGQLLQGRFGAAVVFFFGTLVLWVITLGAFGWVMHIVAALNAATYKPNNYT